jgi:hypothetical protein
LHVKKAVPNFVKERPGAQLSQQLIRAKSTPKSKGGIKDKGIRRNFLRALIPIIILAPLRSLMIPMLPRATLVANRPM